MELSCGVEPDLSCGFDSGFFVKTIDGNSFCWNFRVFTWLIEENFFSMDFES
jgi:hypothetical protein